MKKKLRTNKCISFIMAFCLLICCQFSANADSQNGSVEIYCHGVTSEGERVELNNAEFVMYKAGEYVNGDWILTQEFSQSGAQLGDMSASYQREAAKVLYAYAVENDLQYNSSITDSNGRTTFSQLDLGLYLVSMKGDYIYGNGVFHSAPFLVTMPITESGDITFNFTVEPKAEWEEDEKPSETTEPTSEPVSDPTASTSPTNTTSPTGSTSTKPTEKPGSQQTGQNPFPWQPVVSLAVISLLVILALKRKNKID